VGPGGRPPAQGRPAPDASRPGGDGAEPPGRVGGAVGGAAVAVHVVAHVAAGLGQLTGQGAFDPLGAEAEVRSPSPSSPPPPRPPTPPPPSSSTARSAPAMSPAGAPSATNAPSWSRSPPPARSATATGRPASSSPCGPPSPTTTAPPSTSPPTCCATWRPSTTSSESDAAARPVQRRGSGTSWIRCRRLTCSVLCPQPLSRERSLGLTRHHLACGNAVLRHFGLPCPAATAPPACRCGRLRIRSASAVPGRAGRAGADRARTSAARLRPPPGRSVHRPTGPPADCPSSRRRRRRPGN